MALAVICSALEGAEPGIPVPTTPAPIAVPLAFSIAPPCSKRPGIRAVRSDVIQLGDVSVSLSAQATRENESCVQSAALWVTQKGVSEQFDLHDAAANSFEIIDIAPDYSAILLSSVAIFPKKRDDTSMQLGILSLADGAFKWSSLAELVGLKKCDASIDTAGFLDATQVLITATPRNGVRPRSNCPSHAASFSYDVTNHSVKPSAKKSVQRLARSVAGPLESCQSDPDVAAACYTKRARLSVLDTDGSMQVWPVGEKRVFAVDDGRLPSNLISAVTPSIRVFATMVICPLLVERPGRYSHICIDSATDLHPEAVPPKVPAAIATVTQP